MCPPHRAGTPCHLLPHTCRCPTRAAICHASIPRPPVSRRDRDPAADQRVHVLPLLRAARRTPPCSPAARTATPTHSRSSTRTSASTSRSRCSTGTSCRASSPAATSPSGTAPPPASATPSPTSEPVWDTIIDRFPTTLSLAIGGAAVFLIVGLGTGMLAAWQAGHLHRQVLQLASRWCSARCRSTSSARCAGAASSTAPICWTSPQYVALHRESRRLVQRPADALAGAVDDLHRQVHPYGALRDDRAAPGGPRPHGPRQGHVRPDGLLPLRLARLADPHRHHLRHRPRLAASAAR